MNIIQQEDLVKGMPDDLLMQQAQAPSGDIPQFLLISEVKRRTDMRQRFEAQQKNMPEQTVADQVLAQGLGSMNPNKPPHPSQMPPRRPDQMPNLPQGEGLIPSGLPPQRDPNEAILPPGTGLPQQPPPQRAYAGGRIGMEAGGRVPESMQYYKQAMDAYRQFLPPEIDVPTVRSMNMSNKEPYDVITGKPMYTDEYKQALIDQGNDHLAGNSVESAGTSGQEGIGSIIPKDGASALPIAQSRAWTGIKNLFADDEAEGTPSSVKAGATKNDKTVQTAETANVAGEDKLDMETMAAEESAKAEKASEDKARALDPTAITEEAAGNVKSGIMSMLTGEDDEMDLSKFSKSDFTSGLLSMANELKANFPEEKMAQLAKDTQKQAFWLGMAQFAAGIAGNKMSEGMEKATKMMAMGMKDANEIKMASMVGKYKADKDVLTQKIETLGTAAGIDVQAYKAKLSSQIQDSENENEWLRFASKMAVEMIDSFDLEQTEADKAYMVGNMIMYLLPERIRSKIDIKSLQDPNKWAGLGTRQQPTGNAKDYYSR